MEKLKAGDNAFIVLAENDGDGNVVAVVVNRPLKECEEYLVDLHRECCPLRQLTDSDPLRE